MELVAAVLIYFCASLREEEIFLTSLTVMLQFWEETRIHHKMGYVVVTIQGVFKGETGDKYEMLMLVDRT